ncbi:hypothetical protein JR316_0010246 [Psilocybe cubensis]|uniref:Uncharacterized protein n=1 Tax=Psilocybe cubensis TaxID=181762 RepID=A0ACB8GRH0_PSICU|nr:hypothetical protein JR316_0010246 [Psilocybe cubensis]KAH9478012.1 hypothetical protein JR316_0010246 [Psilocybe cubensis]
MISREETRQYLKYTLSVARIKLLYEKITLTRYTSLYFLSTLLACIVLSALQVVSLVHDSEGVVNVSSVLDDYNRDVGIAVLKGDTVQLCSGLPHQSGTVCNDIINFKDTHDDLNVRNDLFESDSDDSDDFDDSDSDSEFSSDDSDDEFEATPTTTSSAVTSSAQTTSSFEVTISTETLSSSVVTIDSSTTFVEVITTSPPIPDPSTEVRTSTSEILTTSVPPVLETPSSSSSVVVPVVTPTLTVVTTSSSSSLTSLSSIVFPPASSTTSFIFSSSQISTSPSTSIVPTSSIVETSVVVEGTTTFPDAPNIPVVTSASVTSSSQQPFPSVVTPSVPAGTASPVGSHNNSPEFLEEDCIISLTWLKEVIRDTQREDIVIFVFQFWLFGLSVVTVLNESIPHLGAGCFGHILGTAWAGYRVYSTHGLMDRYRNHMVPEACSGRDIMGDWWENRIEDGIALLALQAVSLVIVLLLSLKLFNVYARQTFKRAGASSDVLFVYKLVLVFSVCLQLSGFISVASAAIWIDKVSHAPLAGLAKHAKLYLSAFIVTSLIQIPWVILGWVCVRRESRAKFSMFCLLSAILLGVSIAMFCSHLYRFLVSSWPFFASMTITAFILVVGTTVLGVFCRLKFGGGLAEHLRDTENRPDQRFDPVYFTAKDKFHDLEKFGPPYQTTELPTVPLPLDDQQYGKFPVPLYASSPDATTKFSNTVSRPPVPTLNVPSVDVPIVPVTRMSVFSKVLREFSMRPPSPSVKSMMPEPLTPTIPQAPSVPPHASVSQPVPLTPGDIVGSSSEAQTKEIATPGLLALASPMDTASAYSFVTPRQTMVNQELPIGVRKGGIPCESANNRQSSGSAYSATSSTRKYGLPSNPRQSTSSSFSFTNSSLRREPKPRFPEDPRSSVASDTRSVGSRLVGLPSNPRSRMVSSTQSHSGV